MNTVVLSDYIHKTSKLIGPINVNDINIDENFQINNLVIKEYFKKENDGTFSYTNETMIVSDIFNQNDLTLVLKNVIVLENKYNLLKAYVSNYEETFHYIDDLWKSELDFNSNNTCDNITLINQNDFVYRTNISKGYMFEENGKLQNAVDVRAKIYEYKPSWCKI